MGPYTLDIYAPSDIRPRETAGRPPPYRTHLDKGPSATIPGIQSMEGKTSPNSSWPHTENHHACHAYGSDSHSPRPSTQSTIPPGTTTTVPILDEHSSCGCLRQSQPVPDTGSKTPADCDEIPTRECRRSHSISIRCFHIVWNNAFGHRRRSEVTSPGCR